MCEDFYTWLSFWDSGRFFWVPIALTFLVKIVGLRQTNFVSFKNFFKSLRGKSLTLLNILVQWYLSLEIEGRATRTGWIHVALRNTLPARSSVITEIGRLAWRSTTLSTSLSAGIVYCTEGMTEAGPVRSGPAVRQLTWSTPYNRKTVTWRTLIISLSATTSN